jgi:hypothetical protein
MDEVGGREQSRKPNQPGYLRARVTGVTSPAFLELDGCGGSDLTPTCSLPQTTGRSFPEVRTRYPGEPAPSSSSSTTSLRVSSIS